MLIAFRALQGVGGAAMAALTLSILIHAFDPEHRTSAVGTWSAISGLGFGLGPVTRGSADPGPSTGQRSSGLMCRSAWPAGP